MPSPLRASRPIAMLSHSYYEEDPRVRRQAESLVAHGQAVDVFALRRPGDPTVGYVEGVHVVRINVQRHQGASVVRYLTEYLSFLVRAGWAISWAHRRRRYSLVQVHTLPDFLVFATAALRMAGVPVLLDLHEAMPEFFRMRFPRASSGLFPRLLVLQEQVATGFASAVSTVNPALAARLVRLGVPAGKVTVIANAPSLRRFDRTAYPARPFMSDGVLRLAYAGALTPTYELEVAVRALAQIAASRSDLPFVLDLYGRGDSEPVLRGLARDLDLDDRVRFHGRIPIEDVPAAIAGADIGLAPTRRDRFTDLSLSTKLLEYGAMGRPVVASRLPLVERTFGSSELEWYEPDDPGDLAAAILRLVDHPDVRDDHVARMIERVRGMSWEGEELRYLALVDALIGAA